MPPTQSHTDRKKRLDTLLNQLESMKKKLEEVPESVQAQYKKARIQPGKARDQLEAHPDPKKRAALQKSFETIDRSQHDSPSSNAPKKKRAPGRHSRKMI